ncbi:unnamed protein product [Ectocarpus sp. 12 AP-2014]
MAASVSKRKKAVTWKDKIQQWKSGEGLPSVTSPVFWETSRAHSGGLCEYREVKTPASKHLSMRMQGDASAFQKHLKGKTTPAQFYNLDQTAILISPPDRGENFAHLALFHKNATLQQRQKLWKKVAQSVEKVLKRGDDAYVSTHGVGVPWLHVRIEGSPKYYVSTSLRKT